MGHATGANRQTKVGTARAGRFAASCRPATRRTGMPNMDKKVFYVYQYVNRSTSTPFYVGKGKLRIPQRIHDSHM